MLTIQGPPGGEGKLFIIYQELSVSFSEPVRWRDGHCDPLHIPMPILLSGTISPFYPNRDYIVFACGDIATTTDGTLTMFINQNDVPCQAEAVYSSPELGVAILSSVATISSTDPEQSIALSLPEEPFGKVGFTVIPKPEGLKIIKLVPDAPASRAGLIIGDTLTYIDGHLASDLTTQDLHRIIIGTVGDEMELTVVRDGTPTEVTLERESFLTQDAM